MLQPHKFSHKPCTSFCCRGVACAASPRASSAQVLSRTSLVCLCTGLCTSSVEVSPHKFWTTRRIWPAESGCLQALSMSPGWPGGRRDAAQACTSPAQAYAQAPHKFRSDLESGGPAGISFRLFQTSRAQVHAQAPHKFPHKLPHKHRTSSRTRPCTSSRTSSRTSRTSSRTSSAQDSAQVLHKPPGEICLHNIQYI